MHTQILKRIHKNIDIFEMHVYARRSRFSIHSNDRLPVLVET